MRPLPLGDEERQFGEEVAPRVLVGWVLAVEGHDVVVGAHHLLEVHLHLLRLAARVLHAPPDDLGDAVLGVELLGVREAACVERLLHVGDVVDVLLGVRLQLLDINLLHHNDARDVVGEVFPLRVLVADNAFDEVGQSGLILVVLHHGQSAERRQLETARLLVRVVHIITNIQNKAKNVHQRDRVPERLGYADNQAHLLCDLVVLGLEAACQGEGAHPALPVVVQFKRRHQVDLVLPGELGRVLLAVLLVSLRACPVLAVRRQLLGKIIRNVAEVILLQEVHDHDVIKHLGVAMNDHLHHPFNRKL